jgi:hypothetical protein
MSTPDPTGNLGQQLLLKLEQDGSAPALELLAKLKAANGNLSQEIAAVEASIASDAGLPLVIVTDEAAVLVQWLFYRVNHWATNHGFGFPATPVAAAPVVTVAADPAAPAPVSESPPPAAE